MMSVSALGAVIAVIIVVACVGVIIASLKAYKPKEHSRVSYKLEPEAPLIKGYIDLSIIAKNDRRSLTHTAKRHGIVLDKDSDGKYIIRSSQVAQLKELVRKGKIVGKKLKATIETLEYEFKVGRVL